MLVILLTNIGDYRMFPNIYVPNQIFEWLGNQRH